MIVAFDVLESYYLPVFKPIINECLDRNIKCLLVFYLNDESSSKYIDIISKEFKNTTSVKIVKNHNEALDYYRSQKTNWIFLGNTHENISEFLEFSKTALIQHGIGPKSCYYTVSKHPVTIRFVEGEFRLNRLQKMYPKNTFIDTGFAKLDPIIKKNPLMNFKNENFLEDKKTILYAPTFYPSSLEVFPLDFPALLSEYNIIIKPHSFTWKKRKYKKQRELLNTWKQYKNVYLCNENFLDILPLYSIADIMISDASSVIFEFIAIGKPVIWSHFFKLRWSYRGIFSFRLKKRLDPDLEYFRDICFEAKNFQEVLKGIPEVIKNPDFKIKERKETTKKLVGKVDGQCSKRIVDYIIGN